MRSRGCSEAYRHKHHIHTTQTQNININTPINNIDIYKCKDTKIRLLQRQCFCSCLFVSKHNFTFYVIFKRKIKSDVVFLARFWFLCFNLKTYIRNLLYNRQTTHRHRHTTHRHTTHRHIHTTHKHRRGRKHRKTQHTDTQHPDTHRHTVLPQTHCMPRDVCVCGVYMYMSLMSALCVCVFMCL